MTEISINEFRQFKERLDKAKKFFWSSIKTGRRYSGLGLPLAGYLKCRTDFKIFPRAPCRRILNFTFTGYVTGDKMPGAKNWI